MSSVFTRHCRLSEIWKPMGSADPRPRVIIFFKKGADRLYLTCERQDLKNSNVDSRKFCNLKDIYTNIFIILFHVIVHLNTHLTIFYVTKFTSKIVQVESCT